MATGALKLLSLLSVVFQKQHFPFTALLSQIFTTFRVILLLLK